MRVSFAVSAAPVVVPKALDVAQANDVEERDSTLGVSGDEIRRFNTPDYKREAFVSPGYKREAFVSPGYKRAFGSQGYKRSEHEEERAPTFEGPYGAGW
jgi:hypothetical protein